MAALIELKRQSRVFCILNGLPRRLKLGWAISLPTLSSANKPNMPSALSLGKSHGDGGGGFPGGGFHGGGGHR
jgi:hypothetical protein